VTLRAAVLTEQLLGRVPGGTGRYTRELTAAMAAQGHELTGWICRHGDPTAAVIPGVVGPRQLPLPAPAVYRLWARGRGPAPRGADVVFCPTMLTAPRRRGVGLVATVHDAVMWTAPETMTPRGLRWHLAMAHRIARDADAVVVPTRAVADALGAYLPGLAAERVHVVGEGVSAAVTTVPPDHDERARRLGLPERYLVTLATLEPRKGLDVALRALTRPELDGLSLVCVGPPGWGGVEPAAMAVQLGLQTQRVRVLGQLSDPDLAVVLHRAAALLVPSRDEGFGLPVIEAMQVGTPVVISSAPALVEVAGGAAEVVAVGDHVGLANAAARAADPAGRADRAHRGREVAARHTWQLAARRAWDVISNAASAT
jgi:glycosyltransferase involved in cell wall biosynthesis